MTNQPKMHRLLMIAYHFPPIQGSSGIHRTVQFARHLPNFGWEPMVVSVHPRAYPTTGDDMLGGLPENVIIRRAFALDSSRHLSIKGKYTGYSAIPDRWISWWLDGVVQCMKLVVKYKPKAIWSTFPVATAHLIGLTVSRLTGLPWIADIRDPMVQDHSPPEPVARSACQYLEKKVIEHATCCVTVTKSTVVDYAGRYPKKRPSFWRVIENGFDESLFEACNSSPEYENEGHTNRPLKMVHSGLLYATGRNPGPFLKALKSFLQTSVEKIEVCFRGCGDELQIQQWITELGLDNVVTIAPSVSYTTAIEEMLRSDVLILFQGTDFRKQIPAKAYEYIRAGKPILALTDNTGETAKILKNWDGVYFGDIESPDNIEQAIFSLFNDIRLKKKPVRSPEKVEALSRFHKTKELVKILNNTVLNNPTT